MIQVLESWDEKMAQTAEILLLAPFLTCRADVLLAVDIEGEVFVLDLFVLAVLANGSDRGVDLVFERVALANRDTHTVTEVLDVGEGRTDEREAFAGVGFQEPIVQQGSVSHGAIEAASGHVEVDFVLRTVRLDLGTQRGQDFAGETLVDRTTLHADVLTLELSQAFADLSAGLHDQASRGVVVLVGEVHRLLAIFSDRHGRQDRVDLAHFKCRDQTVELLLDPDALDLHLFAQGVADVVVKTNNAAVRRLGGKRRVSSFDTDFQRFFIGEGRQGQHGQCQGAKQHKFLHLGTPSVKGKNGRVSTGPICEWVKPECGAASWKPTLISTRATTSE